MSENVLPMISSRSCMLSCFIFKSLSHFEFIFVHGVRVCSSFIDLHVALQFSQHHWWKDCCSHFIFLPPLSKINWPWVSGFISGFSILFHRSVCLLVPVPHCLDDCGFIILPEVWERDASCLVFVLQKSFGNSGSFVVPYKFWDCLF